MKNASACVSSLLFFITLYALFYGDMKWANTYCLWSSSEKEELELQLRAVPEIERRIAELEALQASP